MTWPTDDLDTTQFDAGGDSPADARPMLKKALDYLKAIIAARGLAGGVCELDATGKVPGARIGRNEANGVAGLTAAGKVETARFPVVISHEWVDSVLRLAHLDGVWGVSVDLRGPPGPPGQIGPQGPQGPQGASSSGGGGGGGANDR